MKKLKEIPVVGNESSEKKNEKDKPKKECSWFDIGCDDEDDDEDIDVEEASGSDEFFFESGTLQLHADSRLLFNDAEELDEKLKGI